MIQVNNTIFVIIDSDVLYPKGNILFCFWLLFKKFNKRSDLETVYHKL